MTTGSPDTSTLRDAFAVTAERAANRGLAALWGLFWLLMITVAIQDQLDQPTTLWWEPVLWEGSSALFATLWLVLQRRANRSYAISLDRPARWFWHHTKWLPLVVTTFVACIYATRHAVYALVGKTYAHADWPQLFVYESVKVVLFMGLWLGIIFGIESFLRWQQQRQELLAMQKSLADAQLSQLKGQLRPHFFFNVLNTISALMHVDVERADRLLARLADLLRASLERSGRELSTLREEMRLLEQYAHVMRERFADRVALDWSIEPTTLEASVPVLLLQPLLENAFKHGVEPSREQVRIDVIARLEGDRVSVSIRNTAYSVDPNGLGLGLRTAASACA